jgi:hypothetical protein
MKFLRKKPDQPLQPAPPSTLQKSPPAPPPLFARFASPHPTGSSSSSRIISGPAPLAPRDSVHKQSRPSDGSPPKSTNPRIAALPVQRNRMPFDEQQPVNGGRDDKPLPDPEQTQSQRMNLQAFRRGQVPLFDPRTPPLNTNGLSPGPQKSIQGSGKREVTSRNAEFAPLPLDALSTPARFEDTARKPARTPISGSPERRYSEKTAPVPGPQSSSLLGFQNPPDRPQPRRKYSPLEAFGLVSGENSPAPSTTASSVNLPSQNLVSTPLNVPILPNYRDRSLSSRLCAPIHLTLN